jgi:hypothetical protein
MLEQAQFHTGTPADESVAYRDNPVGKATPTVSFVWRDTLQQAHTQNHGDAFNSPKMVQAAHSKSQITRVIDDWR